MLEALDLAGLEAANQLAHRSAGLDWAMHQLLTVDLLKMGVPALLTLFVWLRPDGWIRGREAFVVRSLAGICLALALGFALHDSLPPRPRPRLAMPAFPFPDLGAIPDLGDYSAFPSDHAVLVAALSATVSARSRPLGLLAAAWSAFAVCFPRLYVGYHYPSDLVAGAALGVLVVGAALRLPLPWFDAFAEALRRMGERVPALVMIGLFLATYEFMTLFTSLRQFGHAARDVLTALGLTA